MGGFFTAFLLDFALKMCSIAPRTRYSSYNQERNGNVAQSRLSFGRVVKALIRNFKRIAFWTAVAAALAVIVAWFVWLLTRPLTLISRRSTVMAAKPAGSPRGSSRAPAAQPTVTTTTTVTGTTDPAAPAATGGAGAPVVEKPPAELPPAAPDQPDPPPSAAPQDNLADDLRIGGKAPAAPPQPDPPTTAPPTPKAPPVAERTVVYFAPENVEMFENLQRVSNETLRATGQTNTILGENTAVLKDLAKEVRENLGAQRQQSGNAGGDPPSTKAGKSGGDGSSRASASSSSGNSWGLIVLFFLFLIVLLVVIYVLEPWKARQTKEMFAPAATQPSIELTFPKKELGELTDAVKDVGEKLKPPTRPSEPAETLDVEKVGTRLDLDTDGETTETWVAINRDLGKPGAEPSMPRKLGGATYIVEKKPPAGLTLKDDEYYGDLIKPHWWDRKEPLSMENVHIKVIRKTLDAGASGKPEVPATGPTGGLSKEEVERMIAEAKEKELAEEKVKADKARKPEPPHKEIHQFDVKMVLKYTSHGEENTVVVLPFPHGEVRREGNVITIWCDGEPSQPIEVEKYDFFHCEEDHDRPEGRPGSDRRDSEYGWTFFNQRGQRLN